MPRAKSNGTWFKVNDKLAYECQDGYKNADGDTAGSIVCGGNGWSDATTCHERECMVPDIEPELLAQPQREKYVIGDVLKFSCRNRLHSLLGPDSIQCYHFGWSPNIPTCKEEVQSCDQPPRLPNGKVAGTPKAQYEHSEVVEYACSPGFLMKGARKIQCVDGEWTPLPVCVEEHSTCGDVPELKDGGVVSPARPSYRHGDSVAFACRDDFTMVGHGSVTCVRGTWTQPPQCIATGELKTCKLSREIASETKLPYRAHYGHNRKISYTCGRKSAQRHSVCMNGKWQPEVTCTEAPRCPPPPQIPNSQPTTLTVNYQEGEKISILCQENFLIQEGEEIVCQDGRWQSIPRCVAKTPCPRPPHVEHGSIKSSGSSEDGGETLEPKLYAHGTTLSYICEDGFKLSQEDGITCHMGKWSASPRCVGLPCGRPPAILNANPPPRLNSFPHGEQYTYTCKPGFRIRGPPSIGCSGGRWSHPPECTRNTCPRPPTFDNAILRGQAKNSYRSGAKVAYKCPDHYQMDGSNVVECRDGIWIGTPTCKDLSCGSPPPVQNAYIADEKPRYQHGDTAHYQCRHLLGLFGNEVVTCLSGNWTDPPVCKDSTGKCGRPPAIDNGDIISSPSPVYAPGSSVEYQCQAYYVLEGNRRITCSDGKWSEPPKCLGNTCPSPPSFDNAILIGQAKNSYLSGEYVMYTCPDYYLMYGPNVVQCREGIWIGTPTCKDVSCGSPPPVQNAYIPDEKPRYQHGDTAHYQCRHLLGLFGNEVVTCLSGNWTDPPVCKDSTGKCGRPPTIDNGDITSFPLTVYAPGSSVEYQCQAYHVLEGNRRITCRNGVWSEPPKCLDPCVISKEVLKQHNIEFRWSHETKLYSRTNHFTEFMCRRGYRPASPESAFRVQCREGKMEYPTCV